jgi:signal transduction histidine kinase
LRGIRARLVLWNVLAIGLILAAMALMLRAHLRQNALLEIDHELRAEAELARTASKSSSTQLHLPVDVSGTHKAVRDSAGSQNRKAVPQEDNSAEVITFEAQAFLPKLIAVPPSSPGGNPAFAPLDPESYREAAAGRPGGRDFQLKGEPFRSYSIPISASGRITAVVQAVRSLAPTEAMLRRFDAALVPLLPVALLVAATAGTVLVAGAMRPLRILTDSAQRLEVDERLPIVGRDEFADLAVAFNAAFDRTSQAMAKQERALRQLERFTGDAGHELRTPLAVVKGSVSQLLSAHRLQGDDRGTLEDVDRAADRMTRLIADLLLLARQDAGTVTVSRQPVPLRPLIESVLDTLPPDDRCPIILQVGPIVNVPGDPAMLERAISNLIANARAYARTRVCVAATSDGSQIELMISDDGEGIAPEHLPRLGERFYRPEAARSRDRGGTGLGLAITKGIVGAHGGELEIRSEVGVGTTVLVRLPAV